MKYTVYTCTIGNYDNLLSPLALTPECRFLHFSERPNRLATRWQHREIPDIANDMQPDEANRYVKLHFHRVLEPCEVSIYVDGNILILSDLTPLIMQFLKSDADIALFPHPFCASVREEIPNAIKYGKVRESSIPTALRQLRDYERAGVADLPATQNSILFRRHDRPALESAMEDWWSELKKYVMRDQFSSPSILSRSGIRIHYWDWDHYASGNAFFHRTAHANRGSRNGLLDVARAVRIKAPFSGRHRLAVEAVRKMKRISVVKR